MKIANKIAILILLFIIGLIVYYYYPEDLLPKNAQIDEIVVYKSKREMLVFSNKILLKTYTISLGRNPIGIKEFEGDKKTPEGKYFINGKNPKSICYKNLGISYPNKDDLERAKRYGKPSGGSIKIHGLGKKNRFVGKFHRWHDWTLGCIAVTNDEIDELYKAVKIRTPIEIKP